MKLPEWVGDRDFLVMRGKKVVAAFYTKEEARAYAEKRGLGVARLPCPKDAVGEILWVLKELSAEDLVKLGN